MIENFPYLPFSWVWLLVAWVIYVAIEAVWFAPFAFGRFLVSNNTRYKPTVIKTSPVWPLNPFVYEAVLVFLKVWILGFIVSVDAERGNGLLGWTLLYIAGTHNLYVSSHMWESRTFRVTFTNCAYRLVAMIVIALVYRFMAI